MKVTTILSVAFAVLTIAACSDKKPAEHKEGIGLQTKIDGDSTLYGLACDGCTDSVLVFLPGSGGDPVTYNIIGAMEHHHVLGRPTVGDWVCIIVNGKDTTKADLVINLDKLKGNWARLEMPKLLKKINNDDLLTDDEEHERDSILKSELVPQEIGFSLKRHYAATPIGLWRPNIDKDSPVVFPKPKPYTKWHIFNGHLVLTEGSLAIADSQKKKEEKHDTVDIILLQSDSLRIRYNDGTERGYYRKQNQ